MYQGGEREAWHRRDGIAGLLALVFMNLDMRMREFRDREDDCLLVNKIRN